MPELPEVETVRRTLEPIVVGRRIEAVSVRERRLRYPIDRRFAADLSGRSILNLSRAGKYLLFGVDGRKPIWLVHLGMSGSLAAGHDESSPHTHVSVRLSDGTVLLYHDPRRFGLMKLVRDRGCAELAALGVDPLSAEFTPELLRAHCTRRKRPIKNILMDQRVVAGLGNIYVNEILFRAGVRPSRAGRRLARREIAAIVAAAQAVLDEALRLGGSSISDYRDGLGRPGYFQLRLDVYGRDGAACPTCRQPIRARILAGRSSFYCPRCQA